MMPTKRPALPSMIELRVPMVYPMAPDWSELSTKLTTDLVARANRQWLDFWFANANRAMDLWWATLPSRGKRR